VEQVCSRIESFIWMCVYCVENHCAKRLQRGFVVVRQAVSTDLYVTRRHDVCHTGGEP